MSVHKSRALSRAIRKFLFSVLSIFPARNNHLNNLLTAQTAIAYTQIQCTITIVYKLLPVDLRMRTEISNWLIRSEQALVTALMRELINGLETLALAEHYCSGLFEWNGRRHLNCV